MEQPFAVTKVQAAGAEPSGFQKPMHRSWKREGISLGTTGITV